ncbi:hypothetical protein NIES73_13140 [Sphaerospermopsis kisseleviana NIES-73]|nr:hypothetical protein NIES73_13120 [Sphaerospermopsis kisseleviana NIES-73]BAZ80065.1 hypothetical protein NIES73_13130 [Sphaerospermopsis kisseleviana NIES-73]BAZ80066.1 hypothetical protein NIES73_13140 [Sphaerospermopsis kisseleviana NIES-73]
MQVINNNELFTQVAAEESSVVSGGNLVDFAAFSFLATTPASFGGVAYVPQEFVVGMGILSQP